MQPPGHPFHIAVKTQGLAAPDVAILANGGPWAKARLLLEGSEGDILEVRKIAERKSIEGTMLSRPR